MFIEVVAIKNINCNEFEKTLTDSCRAQHTRINETFKISLMNMLLNAGIDRLPHVNNN